MKQFPKIWLKRLFAKATLPVLILCTNFSFSQSGKIVKDIYEPLYSNNTWNLKALDSIIPDSVSVLGLGEVSHGSLDLLILKDSIVQYLVQYRNYRTVFFELPDFGMVMSLRNILHDVNDTSLIRLDSIINKENSILPAYKKALIPLMRWVKTYNLTHQSDMVNVIGIDPIADANIDMFYRYILYKYAIPISGENIESLYNKWYINNSSELDRLNDLITWYDDNKTFVKRKLPKDEFSLLDYHISIQKNVLMFEGKRKNNQKSVPPSTLFYRDSVMADNVINFGSGYKSIIWAHNGHIYNGNLSLGERLKNRLNENYFILLTDFAQYATSEYGDRSNGSGAPVISTKKFRSNQLSTASELYTKYGGRNGIYIYQTNEDISERINSIDVTGITSILGGRKSFDALVVFDNIGNYFNTENK
ncbi:MAG: hypothetical protein DI598_08605 [Pseudopedobacter saltans]|uniref:Erythromycin esterase n=1 Tax=Pseudopedobacter saltans TaxID=151895 RepID=A0A2W5F2W6_9SPHI|nr:MAG: hypothetical protein DI598_08605 [Pseudopedobacter saltans]